MSESEQQQEYKRYMKILTELKQQINTETEMAQQQEEELRSKTQEALEKVGFSLQVMGLQELYHPLCYTDYIVT